nr:interferon lambda-1 isoform X1 [Macaca fascicularis]
MQLSLSHCAPTCFLLTRPHPVPGNLCDPRKSPFICLHFTYPLTCLLDHPASPVSFLKSSPSCLLLPRPLTCPHHMHCVTVLPQDCLPVPTNWGFLPVLPHMLFFTSPQVRERPGALEAELALTLKVLEAAADTDSALEVVLDQPLHTLKHILSQLQACIQAQPTAGPRTRGRLHHWLHRLQEASEKESPGCLEASVTFNLFRLLIRDLTCVANGDLCLRTSTHPEST